MNIRIFLIGLLSVFCTYSNAQDKSDNIKPQWMHSKPKPTNSTFVYTTKTVHGATLEDARKESVAVLLDEAGLSRGVSVTSDYNSTRDRHTQIINGQRHSESERKFHVTTTVKGKETQFHAENVDEYWERGADGSIKLTTLYMRSVDNTTPRFDDVRLTTNYGARGLWRSAIVPGWGQFYKGSYVKGGLILGGSVLLAGGIIYTENMRQDYMNKIAKTHNTGNIRSYKNSADNFAMGRNICIGTLAALYVYNVVDAIVAPGARRVIMRKNADGSGYALLPSLTADGGPAIVAQVTF